MNIKAVIFDMGRVLVDLDTTRGMFKLFALSHHTDKETAVKRLTGDQLFRQFNAGLLSPEQFYKAMCDRFNISISFEKFAELWCDVFNPMPGMEELLGELNGKIAIGLLSDTDPLHWNYLRKKYPMLNNIQRPTLSFQTGFCKPAPEIFFAAAKNVGFPASNCLYIDDLEENVEGAKQVGMSAIHFRGEKLLRNDLTRLGLLNSPT